MLNDLRFALRQLVRSPGFAILSILTVGLGIGACTAIFSVVNGVLLRPLDFKNPEQIVAIRETQTPKFPEFAVAPANFADWQKQAKSFSHLTAYSGTSMNMTGQGEPQRLLGVRATAQYFDVFGVEPMLGRTFLPEEDAVGKNRVVVISYPFWQRVFGGAANALGKTVQLNGEPHEIIGVAPPKFGATSKVDLWTPMAFQPEELSNDRRGAHYVAAAGRLRDGVSPQAADAELKLIAAQLEQQYPNSNKGWSAFARPYLDYIVSDIKKILYTLLAAVGCVLLIACANIANLLLARATARHKEIAIRRALGAGRRRLMRQLLTESVLLSVVGGLAGVLLAIWGVNILLTMAPADLPRAADITLDARVLLFAGALSIATGILFGIAPAWFAARTSVHDSLKQGSRGSTEGGGTRLRGVLVVLEVAIALVLLTASGLLVRSFMKLARVDPGFEARGAIVASLTLPEKKYAEPNQQIAFVEAARERLASLPGVTALGATTIMPLVDDMVLSFTIAGRPPIAPGDKPSTNCYMVTPGFFEAMKIRLIRGRFFTSADHPEAPRVAIINETFARLHFPGEDPIGKRLNISQDEGEWSEIIGIVADVAQYGVDKITPAQAYQPYAQRPDGGLNFIIRSSAPPTLLLSSVRQMIYAVDKDQPLQSVRLLEEVIGENIAPQRFAMLLLTVFSVVALVIAAIGIYGVMAYNVVQRTSELGIRMALGAQQADVLRLVLTEAGKMIGIGLLLGLAGTVATARLLRSMLFQTSSYDPPTLGGITLLLVAVAVIACVIPALRATRVSPMEALRAE